MRRFRSAGFDLPSLTPTGNLCLRLPLPLSQSFSWQAGGWHPGHGRPGDSELGPASSHQRLAGASHWASCLPPFTRSLMASPRRVQQETGARSVGVLAPAWHGLCHLGNLIAHSCPAITPFQEHVWAPVPGTTTPSPRESHTGACPQPGENIEPQA